MGPRNVCPSCPGHYLCLQFSSFPEIIYLDIPAIRLSTQLFPKSTHHCKKTNSVFSLSLVSSSISRVSFLSPTLCPSSSLWHTRAITHGNLSPLLQPSFWVALPHLPDFSAHAVLSESPDNHQSLHSFTASTTAQPLRLRAKVTSSGEKFPNSQAK